MKAYERFLQYIAVNTKSDDASGTVPSSACQFDLARMLGEELVALGCANVTADDKCYVYAEIPATEGYEDRVRLGLIAHMDTSPDFSGEGVKPQIIENYDGGEVVLGTSGRTLSPDVVICDEIGGFEEAESILSVQSCGVPLVASTHAATFAQVIEKPAMRPLLEHRVFGGFVGIQKEAGQYLYQVNVFGDAIN